MRVNVKYDVKKFFVKATVSTDYNCENISAYIERVVSNALALDAKAVISLHPVEENHLGLSSYRLTAKDDLSFIKKLKADLENDIIFDVRIEMNYKDYEIVLVSGTKTLNYWHSSLPEGMDATQFEFLLKNLFSN